MLLNKEDITALIPQKPPFVMLDELLTANNMEFRSMFAVKNDCIFIKNGILQEAALIENIAQTVAAGFGYLDKMSGGKPKIGFIGSIDKLKVHQLPVLYDKIETRIILLHQFENVHLIKGENRINKQLLIECEMKIVVQE